MTVTWLRANSATAVPDTTGTTRRTDQRLSVPSMRIEAALFFVVFVAFAAPTSAKSVNFTDCGSEVGKLVSVDISPCDSEPCVLKIGTTVSVTITLIPHEQVTSGLVEATAVIDGVNLPVPVPNPDPCQGYGMSCPLAGGKQQEMALKQYIEESFPAVKLQLIVDILDQSNKKVFCGQLDLQISD